MACGRLPLSWAFGAACAFEPPLAELPEHDRPLEPPQIASMASSSVRVGDRLAFAGDGFIAPELGRVEVTFEGTFEHALGTDAARAVLIAERTEAGRIETTFGPFTIPFTDAGDVTGVFRGKAFATNLAFDGREQAQDQATWPEVELTVLPSIVIRAFEPKLHRVEIGPPDAIAETPYRLTIEAVGFSPASIEYVLGEGTLIDGRAVDRVIHDVIDATDTLGDRELFSFAPLPTGVQEFVAPIVIRASSERGETFSLGLNAVVR